MRAEFLALQTLKQSGLNASRVRLLESEGRVFLEIERFDRVGPRGRRPYLSLAAVEDQLFGRRDNVRASIERLRQRDWIDQNDAQASLVASLFGDFIGNSDQHFGNVSFSWTPQGFILAPLYDILPMWYRPAEDRASSIASLHPLPVCVPGEEGAYALAREAAMDFWAKTAVDHGSSAEFRRLAGLNLQRIQKAQ